MNTFLRFLILLVACITSTAIAQAPLKFTVSSEFDAANVPVKIPLASAPGTSYRMLSSDGEFLGMGQVAAPSLLRPDVQSELHFVLPSIKKGQPLSLVAQPGTAKSMKFAWPEGNGKRVDLNYGGRHVLTYMHEAPDWSSKERLGETYKVYHHVYAPDGTTLLTKGPGGLFPHHRGLFFGFNRIQYGDGKKADIWHCRNGETQEHKKILLSEAGPVFGRHRLEIEWHGRDKQVFATEHRELTAYQLPGGTLIEFATRLTSQVGPMTLDGDPQHAGFQFRATQHVPDKTKKMTYYVRPDGKGKPGKFRNWPKDKTHVDLPWNALSIVVDDQRYTIAYVDRPENPKESRFSERDYGRFGSYFKTTVDKDNPLELNYRVWVQEGEMSVAEVNAISQQFVQPPSVTLMKPNE